LSEEEEAALALALEAILQRRPDIAELRPARTAPGKKGKS
jgi:hypothetical protein